MWTTSGEGAGSCWAHNFKGSRFVEGTPGYAACVKAVGTWGQLRKDVRAFEAASSRPGGTLDMVLKERTYGSEKEWMGRRIGGRRRGGKGWEPCE